jgi:hypothetical protein
MGHPYFELDQLIGCQLGQDWLLEFEGVYQAAEVWMTRRSDDGLRRLVAEIDVIFDLEKDTAARRKHFRTGYAFSSLDDSFDVWLRAVQRRATEALAGIHTNPLQDPPKPGGTDAHPS